MRSEAIEQDLIEELIKGQGLPALARVLAEHFQNPVVITDAAYRVLALQTFSKLPPIDLEYLPLPLPDGGALARLKNKVIRGYLDTGKNGVVPYVQTTIGADDLAGFLLVLEQDREWPEEQNEPLLKTAKLVLVEMLKQRAVLETERKFKGELIGDLLYNNFESVEAIAGRGRRWGWDLLRPYALAVLELDQEEPYPDQWKTMELFENLVSNFLENYKPDSIYAQRGNQLILLVPYTSETKKAAVKEEVNALISQLKKLVCARLPKKTFSAGVGYFYDSAGELYRSFQEAKTALELSKYFGGTDGLEYFDELGFLRLLYQLGEQVLKEFADGFLAPLRQHDAGHDSHLVDSLKVFFQCDCDLNQTADQLFIHVNTLRYRLKKIQEVLGVDLNKMDTRTNLYIALKAAAIADSRAK